MSFCGGVCALGCNVYQCLQSRRGGSDYDVSSFACMEVEEDGLCLVQGNVKHEMTLLFRAFWILDDVI